MPVAAECRRQLQSREEELVSVQEQLVEQKYASKNEACLKALRPIVYVCVCVCVCAYIYIYIINPKPLCI